MAKHRSYSAEFKPGGSLHETSALAKCVALDREDWARASPSPGFFGRRPLGTAAPAKCCDARYASRSAPYFAASASNSYSNGFPMLAAHRHGELRRGGDDIHRPFPAIRRA